MFPANIVPISLCARISNGNKLNNAGYLIYFHYAYCSLFIVCCSLLIKMTIAYTIEKIKNFGIPQLRGGIGIFLLCVIGIAIFGHVIANDQHRFFPALIPYSATHTDLENTSVSPFQQQNVSSLYERHWLGTDNLGRDVASGIINGTRTALMVGFGGSLIALLLGTLIGVIAGYFGDHSLRFRLGALIGWLVVFSLSFFLFDAWVEQDRSFLIGSILLKFFTGFALFVLVKTDKLFKNVPILKTYITLPADLVLMRFTEIVQAIPIILWLMAAVAISQKPFSVNGLMIVLGITSWMNFARLARAETLRVRQKDFIEAANILGLSPLKIILKHILPNILSPLLLSATFAVANGILFEALVSFIGLGLPPEQVTWGSLLNAARSDTTAWWLAVFPGLAIFLTVYALNKIGNDRQLPV